MKEPLKPGDRVAVYASERVVGTVTGYFEGNPNAVLVRPDRENYVLPPVHPKQCRRIVKPERREWEGEWKQVYIASYDTSRPGYHTFAFVPEKSSEELQTVARLHMRLREVRKKDGK